MKALIKKDVYLIGIWGHLFVFGFTMFFTFPMALMFSIWTNIDSTLALTVMSFFPHSILLSMMNKTQSNGDATLNSLPLEKEKIVLGRYLSVLIYSAIMPVFIYIWSHFIRLATSLEGDNKLKFSAIFVAIAFLTIINSVHLLIYYTRGDGHKKVEMLTTITIGVIFFLGISNTRYILDLKFLKYLESFNIVLLLFFVFSIIIYGISFNISKKMYEKKEF